MRVPLCKKVASVGVAGAELGRMSHKNKFQLSAEFLWSSWLVLS